MHLLLSTALEKNIFISTDHNVRIHAPLPQLCPTNKVKHRWEGEEEKFSFRRVEQSFRKIYN